MKVGLTNNVETMHYKNSNISHHDLPVLLHTNDKYLSRQDSKIDSWLTFLCFRTLMQYTCHMTKHLASNVINITLLNDLMITNGFAANIYNS